VTLAEALATGRLDVFIAEAEANGVGPADHRAFAALMKSVTAPLPEDQTSRSRARGGSRGTQTR
jgi:hypothetical protein